MEFTKRKFLAFSPTKQHKICAKLLRDIYEECLAGKIPTRAIDDYHEIISWLGSDTLPNTDIKSIADRYHHHLRLALVKHKEHNLLPLIRQGDKTTAQSAWPIAIYFDHIRSAHNVGSMLRTIEAFSMGKAFFSSDTPFATDKQVQDTAMGATQWIECQRDIPLEALIRPIIALETSPDAISLFDFIFPETFTLVVGNEEYGCSTQTLQLADMIIEIPLRGRKNSLNVANAFAIAAAEICRQRIQRP